MFSVGEDIASAKTGQDWDTGRVFSGLNLFLLFLGFPFGETLNFQKA